MSYAKEFERKINAAIVGKTVKSADVNGHWMQIEFADGTVFDYNATDGGYSCWSIEKNWRSVL